LFNPLITQFSPFYHPPVRTKHPPQYPNLEHLGLRPYVKMTYQVSEPRVQQQAELHISIL